MINNFITIYSTLSFEEINNNIENGDINIGQLWVFAIRFNHLHLVKILSSKINYCPGLIDIVAEYGYIEMLIWLYNNREEMHTVRTIHLAAVNGHLPVVKFLYNNLDYDSQVQFRVQTQILSTLIESVKYGHTEVIKWLYYNTDIIIENTIIMHIATVHKQIDIVNWLKNEVCER